jgi:hypothetical protein
MQQLKFVLFPEEQKKTTTPDVKRIQYVVKGQKWILASTSASELPAYFRISMAWCELQGKRVEKEIAIIDYVADSKCDETALKTALEKIGNIVALQQTRIVYVRCVPHTERVQAMISAGMAVKTA